MIKAVIVGQGYVGLPLAVAAANAGVEVRGLDVNAKVVDDLNHGLSHIDDVSGPDLRQTLRNGYRATTDPNVIGDADIVVVCVPTPLGSDGLPDLDPVMDAARTVGAHLSPGATVILESTTHPGTTEELFTPLVLTNRFKLDRDAYVAFSPERVDPGNHQFGIRNTPKIVGGLTADSTERACAFYKLFVDTVVPAKGAKEAEMAKLLENTYRHVNIALVNEMLRFSNDLGVDLWNAIDCAATKPFGFQAFRPGPGVGGHCIPVDPNYLSHQVKARLGYAFRMVELAQEINGAAPKYVVERAWRSLNELGKAAKGASVLLVGVTYKINTSDMRESPAIPVAEQLAELGASVAYLDPYVEAWAVQGVGQVKRVTSVEDAGEYDLVILLQPHSAIDRTTLVAKSNWILDTRGTVSGERVTRL